ncbi:calcineurin-like phosphoesterase C-terminal domain-containing protein [Thermomonas brevis]|uniref:Calcineurin-like phosphoesterase C-terminal domain-containing protein n=1 Tax=Thermomonas brevis TaxID=215691 RepID=A0A7G9QSS6_9GAMM|nr:calcineurin-like phosphoesterase C-terminal domain-containing protein [Thermomonas brevis]
MRRFLILAVLLSAALPAWADAPECVPVDVEAPLALPRAQGGQGAGCIAYRRVARGVEGDAAQVLVFGDPQVKSDDDVDYFRRDIVQPLQGRHAARLGITLGDLVDDTPALLPAVKRTTETLGVPWLYAPGNHDVDAGAASDEASLSAFHRAIGPDTRARETALANFVVFDDVVVLPGQKPAYVGGLRAEQFAFLERWLPTLPKDRLLVLAMHIPLFDKDGRETFRHADRTRLFALLKDFPHVLVLSAHSHTQQHVFHGAASGWQGEAPLHEYNVGAACGAYWSGAKDADGIPDATMPDGTPNGYAVLTVKRGGDYALAWHNARDAADSQIGLHAPKVLRRGAYPAWGVFANVYMGDDDTRVEFRVDGGDWMPMKKVLQPDPNLMAENRRDDEAEALRGFDRSPEAETSTHLWRGALPTKLAAGEHRVEVRAFDRWRGEVRANTTYRLLESEAADSAQLPLRSQAALDAYLATHADRATPFDPLPPLARARFLSSLRFGSKGLVGFDTRDLATELTPPEIERVLALFDAADYAKMVRSRHPFGPPTWRGHADAPGRIETGFDALYRMQRAEGGDVQALQERIAALVGDLPRQPDALRALPERELIHLLRALDLLPEGDLDARRAVVAEMQRRGIAQPDDLRQIYDALLLARRFDEAARHAAAHPQAGLPMMPAIVNAFGTHASGPTVWRSSADGATLTRTLLDTRGTTILVTAGCHFSADAAEDIGRDPLLGPVFAAHAHWLMLPPGREDLDAVRDWNRRFPAAQAELIHASEEWPQLPADWPMPGFFIVRDGKVVERIVGWPRDPADNRQPLIDALARAGLLEKR